MTITPEPTDKLDAAMNIVVNGPADETLQASRSYGVAPPALNGLLAPGAVKTARRVLRRAWAQQCALAYPTHSLLRTRRSVSVPLRHERATLHPSRRRTGCLTTTSSETIARRPKLRRDQPGRRLPPHGSRHRVRVAGFAGGSETRAFENLSASLAQLIPHRAASRSFLSAPPKALKAGRRRRRGKGRVRRLHRLAFGVLRTRSPGSSGRSRSRQGPGDDPAAASRPSRCRRPGAGARDTNGA
jgi:hypothetical protein